MSIEPSREAQRKLFSLQRMYGYETQGDGGAGRDRTDDLKLAKLPLSQLSYSPLISTLPDLVTA